MHTNLIKCLDNQRKTFDIKQLANTLQPVLNYVDSYNKSGALIKVVAVEFKKSSAFYCAGFRYVAIFENEIVLLSSEIKEIK